MHQQNRYSVLSNAGQQRDDVTQRYIQRESGESSKTRSSSFTSITPLSVNSFLGALSLSLSLFIHLSISPYLANRVIPFFLSRIFSSHPILSLSLSASLGSLICSIFPSRPDTPNVHHRDAAVDFRSVKHDRD